MSTICACATMSVRSRPVPSRNFVTLAPSPMMLARGQAGGVRLQAASGTSAAMRSSGAVRRAKRMVGLAAMDSGERIMSAVAKRLGAGGLAAAKPQLLAVGRLIHDGLDAGPGMGAVAEGLFLAAAAGAPEVGAPGDDVDAVGRLLGGDRIGHSGVNPQGFAAA